MTRRHALLQLLKHGPMTFAEMLEVTGWTYEQLKGTKDWLSRKGLIRKARLFNGWYAP